VTLLTDMETKYQNLKMAVAFLHASECKTTASNFGCNAVTYVNAVVQILSVCLSVSLSHADMVSKWLNMSSVFSHCPSFYLYLLKTFAEIQKYHLHCGH